MRSQSAHKLIGPPKGERGPAGVLRAARRLVVALKVGLGKTTVRPSPRLFRQPGTGRRVTRANLKVEASGTSA